MFWLRSIDRRNAGSTWLWYNSSSKNCPNMPKLMSRKSREWYLLMKISNCLIPCAINFTIAEELAHCLIHHKVFKGKSFLQSAQFTIRSAMMIMRIWREMRNILQRLFWCQNRCLLSGLNFIKPVRGESMKNPIEAMSLVCDFVEIWIWSKQGSGWSTLLQASCVNWRHACFPGL